MAGSLADPTPGVRSCQAAVRRARATAPLADDAEKVTRIVAALASLNLVYYALRFGQERGLITKGGDEPLADSVPQPGAVIIEYVDEGALQ